MAASQHGGPRPVPPPAPLHGGPLTLLRFARRNGMLTRGHARLALRWLWLKARWRGRLRTDGMCFIGPDVKFEIGSDAQVSLGRWSWIGGGTKVRCHEGEVHVGSRTVIGEEVTINCYQRISIGRACLVADRSMFIDFDHGASEVERPIRAQGVYKRDVQVGDNVWIGFGASVLRGVTIGDNAIIGTSAVVTRDVPADAVVGGVPARLLRMRAKPRTLRWR